MHFFALLFVTSLSAATDVDPRESSKEVCFGRKNPKCSTVSRTKITRRDRGKVSVKKITQRQYIDARRAIENFMVSANNGKDCLEPVEIADFVGESLVRVQSYCAPTKVVRNLKKRL